MFNALYHMGDGRSPRPLNPGFSRKCCISTTPIQDGEGCDGHGAAAHVRRRGSATPCAEGYFDVHAAAARGAIGSRVAIGRNAAQYECDTDPHALRGNRASARCDSGIRTIPTCVPSSRQQWSSAVRVEGAIVVYCFFRLCGGEDNIFLFLPPFNRPCISRRPKTTRQDVEIT